MGIVRFVKKGVTLKRILNLYPIKIFFITLRSPFYKLFIYNSNANSILIKKINFKLAAIFNVVPCKFSSVNESDVLNQHLVVKNTIEFIYSKPVFWDSEYKQNLEISKYTRDNNVIEFREMIITGGSSLLELKDNVIFYENSEFDKDNLINYESDLRIKYSTNGTHLIKKQNAKRLIEKGIWLGGSYSFNYYHFMFEYLIKLVDVNNSNISSNTPLIMDSVCLQIPTFKELIDILNTKNREIISIDYSESCKVNDLFFVSCPNYIPLDFKNINTIKACDLLFDKFSIQNLRKKLLVEKSDIKTPKRFFITRKNASGKRPFNEIEVFEVLEAFGFERIAPEEYSIRDQIALFNNAEFIVGGSGAAFTNLLFCNESCKVILFQKHKIEFSGFSTISTLLNVSLIYFTEDYQDTIKLKDLHNSFSVNISLLKRYLNQFLVV